MPLDDQQRNQLAVVNAARLALRSKEDALEGLLRDVQEWDEGTASALVRSDMTNAEALAIFTGEYNNIKAAIREKAEALP